MKKFFWILTIIGAILGALTFAMTMSADSAPKQAAGAGMALCFVVIPYCLAKAISEISTQHEPTYSRPIASVEPDGDFDFSGLSQAEITSFQTKYAKLLALKRDNLIDEFQFLEEKKDLLNELRK